MSIQKPLSDKLGIQSKFKIQILHPPIHYLHQLKPLPTEIEIISKNGGLKDFIQIFISNIETFTSELPYLIKDLKQNGMIWVSWIKKSSKLHTNITENQIRDIGLSFGLVDIKIVSIDDNWSALKFVIPLKSRRKD